MSVSERSCRCLSLLLSVYISHSYCPKQEDERNSLPLRAFSLISLFSLAKTTFVAARNQPRQTRRERERRKDIDHADREGKRTRERKGSDGTEATCPFFLFFLVVPFFLFPCHLHLHCHHPFLLQSSQLVHLNTVLQEADEELRTQRQQLVAVVTEQVR